jgi:hypothetical protein
MGHMVNGHPIGTGVTRFFSVFWIGILLRPIQIQIRLSVLMPIQICILPNQTFTHVGRTEILLDTYYQQCHFAIFLLFFSITGAFIYNFFTVN